VSLNETQQTLLDAICRTGGGVDIHEAMELTGLSYPGIERTAYELLSMGYKISALSVGSGNGSWIKRLFLSPYDPKHEELIKN